MAIPYAGLFSEAKQEQGRQGGASPPVRTLRSPRSSSPSFLSRAGLPTQLSLCCKVPSFDFWAPGPPPFSCMTSLPTACALPAYRTVISARDRTQEALTLCPSQATCTLGSSCLIPTLLKLSCSEHGDKARGVREGGLITGCSGGREGSRAMLRGPEAYSPG